MAGRGHLPALWALNWDTGFPEEPLCICAVPQWDLLCLSPVQGCAERLFGRDFRDSRALGLCPPFQISRREGRGSGAAVCVLLDPQQGVAFST